MLLFLFAMYIDDWRITEDYKRRKIWMQFAVRKIEIAEITAALNNMIDM